jgi:hypothetical protein
MHEMRIVNDCAKVVAEMGGEDADARARAKGKLGAASGGRATTGDGDGFALELKEEGKLFHGSAHFFWAVRLTHRARFCAGKMMPHLTM